VLFRKRESGIRNFKLTILIVQTLLKQKIKNHGKYLKQQWKQTATKSQQPPHLPTEAYTANSSLLYISYM